MAENNSAFSSLTNRYALVVTLFLIAQAIGLYGVSRREAVPLARPLAEFPLDVGHWRTVEQGVVEKETMDVLRADDVLTRLYYDTVRHRGASLFVAYFKSQRTGQMPHSPKNCLPGSGWAPLESAIVSLRVPGLAAPIQVNRYVVAKGDSRSVVLYWYQSRDRVIASEYRARLSMIADAIRHNRTDTALVRVVVPVSSQDPETAIKTAEDFVAAFFLTLRGYLPS